MVIAGVTHNAVRAIGRADMAGWLSPGEIAQYEHLGTSGANDWLAGRVAMKQACVDFSLDECVSPSTFVISHDLVGAPFVGVLEGVHCSIGHSGGWGIGAISSQPIGVDIERIGNRPSSLIHYISELDEIDLLAAGEKDSRVLVAKMWGVKESAIKAWSRGPSLHPKRVKLGPHDLADYGVTTTTPKGQVSLLKIFLYRKEDFLVTVAVGETAGIRPQIHWLDTPRTPTSAHDRLGGRGRHFRPGR